MVRYSLLISTLLISWLSAHSSLAVYNFTISDVENATIGYDYDTNKNNVTSFPDFQNHHHNNQSRSGQRLLKTSFLDDMIKLLGTPPPPPQDKICGIVADRKIEPLMMNSAPASILDFPWHVGLFLNKSNAYVYICGGTLITNRKVLTAAHCVWNYASGHRRFPDEFRLTIGLQKILSGDKNYDFLVNKVINLEIDPAFTPIYFRADVSVLTLQYPVDFSEYIRPICMWFNESYYDASKLEGKVGTVVGWGTESINGSTFDNLQKIEMPIVADETCRESDPDYYKLFGHKNTFCAGYRNGTNPCISDSGGGMVLKIDSRWYLIGFISNMKKTHDGSCDPNSYTIFMDVGKNLDFIKTYR